MIILNTYPTIYGFLRVVVLIIVIDPQKINICKTLPRRKLALLVSRTGSVGLSISWSDSRLISKSRDFPDLGGWTRPGVFCEAR